MTLTAILRLVLGGLLLILMVATVWWAASCTERRKYSDRPAEELPEKEVIDLVDETAPAGRWSITETNAPVVRRGRAPAEEPEQEATTAFAEAVLDSTGPDSVALLPQARAWRDGDRGGLAVVDSRQEWQTEEFDCKEGRRWEAGTRADGTMYANCERVIPSLLPRIGRTALVCGGAAAAGAGIAIAAKYEEPLLVAGIAGGSCVVLRMAF